MNDKDMNTLIAAIQAADETFSNDDTGNEKFREFVRRLFKPRIAMTVQGLPPSSSGGQIRYAVPM